MGCDFAGDDHEKPDQEPDCHRYEFEWHFCESWAGAFEEEKCEYGEGKDIE